MPIRWTLITTVAAVLAAWPFGTNSLAQTAESFRDEAPGLLVDPSPAPSAAELLIVEVPAPPPPVIEGPPSAAPETPSPAARVAAPAAEPPIVAKPPPVAAAEAAAPAAEPPISGQARRRIVARTTKAPVARPTVGPALILLNARESPVVSVTVTAGDTTVRQTRLVEPNARATVALPRVIGCSVTVEAVFQDNGASEARSIDACKVKLVRLTD